MEPFSYQNNRAYPVWIIYQSARYFRGGLNLGLSRPDQYSIMHLEEMKPREKLYPVVLILGEYENHADAKREYDRRTAEHDYYCVPDGKYHV